LGDKEKSDLRKSLASLSQKEISDKILEILEKYRSEEENPRN